MFWQFASYAANGTTGFRRVAARADAAAAGAITFDATSAAVKCIRFDIDTNAIAEFVARFTLFGNTDALGTDTG